MEMRNWKNIEAVSFGGGETEEGWNYWEVSICGDNDAPDDEVANDLTELANVRVVAVQKDNTIDLVTQFIYKAPEADGYEPVSSRVNAIMLEEKEKLLETAAYNIENGLNQDHGTLCVDIDDVI
ncbi:hypothetical protein [Cohnella sp. GCM10012308]|uniref:hypothetical protein n=1 Tax=Cohnella sp. GCM10012308 TaxID=3317329 RepID=UPI00361E1B20